MILKAVLADCLVVRWQKTLTASVMVRVKASACPRERTERQRGRDTWQDRQLLVSTIESVYLGISISLRSEGEACMTWLSTRFVPGPNAQGQLCLVRYAGATA